MMVLSQSPQALFGVLIALECGMDPVRLATSLGHGVASLLDAAEEARAGRMPRQLAWAGDRMASEARKAGPQPTLREEVLVKRWMRRILRVAAKTGSITRDEVLAQLGAVAEQGADKQMTDLGHSTRSLGIRFEVDRSISRQPTWTLDDASLAQLRALIADDWRIEAK